MFERCGLIRYQVYSWLQVFTDFYLCFINFAYLFSLFHQVTLDHNVLVSLSLSPQ